MDTRSLPAKKMSRFRLLALTGFLCFTQALYIYMRYKKDICKAIKTNTAATNTKKAKEIDGFLFLSLTDRLSPDDTHTAPYLRQMSFS